jgi:hypothetical protein
MADIDPEMAEIESVSPAGAHRVSKVGLVFDQLL